jgi:hypothetical protein
VGQSGWKLRDPVQEILLAVLLDFKYSEEDELAWNAGVFPRDREPSGPAAGDIDKLALAVAVGAVPVSQLRRSLQLLVERGGANDTGPVSVCGAEDSCCGSFLDRYLGGGADESELDDNDLFQPS